MASGDRNTRNRFLLHYFNAHMLFVGLISCSLVTMLLQTDTYFVYDAFLIYAKFQPYQITANPFCTEPP